MDAKQSDRNESDLRGDLGYVRSAVERATDAGPRSIFLLWAVAISVGFALGDFAPERMALYWAVVGPLGWIASAVLGYRHARRLGQLDLRRGWAQAAHFALMLAAMLLAALVAREGLMSWQAMGPIVVILLALTYALAGVHVHRAFFVPAVLFALGFCVLLFGGPWPWTTVGAIAAVGLVVTGWVGGGRGAVAAA